MSNGALPRNVVKESQMPRRSWLSKKINKKKKKRELLRECDSDPQLSNKRPQRCRRCVEGVRVRVQSTLTDR